MKKFLILIFTSFNLFSGNFDPKAITDALLNKTPEEILTYAQSLTVEQAAELKKYIVNSYKHIFLEVVKPGLESFTYIENKRFFTIEMPRLVALVKFFKNAAGQQFLVVVSNIYAENEQQFDIWDLQEKPFKKIKTINFNIYKVHGLDISEDGRYAIIGAADGKIVLVDLFTCKSKKLVTEEPYSICEVKFSSDGKFAIAGSSTGYIYKVNLEPLIIEKMPTTRGNINPISISKDNKYALISSPYSALVYDLNSGNTVDLLALLESKAKLKISNVSCARFSPHDNFIYISGGYELYCVDISGEAPKIINKFTVPSKKVTFDPTGKFAITIDEYSVGRDALSLVNLNSEQTKTILINDSQSLNPVISPDGKFLVTKSRNIPNLQLWDTTGWAIQELTVTQLLVLIKAANEKDASKVLEYYKFFEKSGYCEMVKNFFEKLLMTLGYDAPVVLQDLVKEFM